MSVTSNLEKVFFAYILENPLFFEKVAEHYFENEYVKYIYSITRKYYLSQKVRSIPSPKKIVELVRLEDRTKDKISDDLLKTVLKTDIGEYQDNADDIWLDRKLKAWIVEKGIRDRIVQSIDKLRNLDDKNIDYDTAVEVFHDVKNIVGDTSLISYDNDDLGLDFDDPESHEQDTIANKITSGWKNFDSILNGGWDRKTLNIFMAPSNAGKSLWLGNCAVNAANAGKNVVIVTLEMSEKKVIKRIGSARLRIPIYEYDELSKDTNFIKQKLVELKHGFNKGADMFENKIGKIRVKEYPSGTATVYDLDEYIKRYQEQTGISIDLLIVDYLTIMNPGIKNGTLYSNGKALAEGLRAIAQKHDLVCISAMQVAKDAYDANDLTAKDISESKAILETADTLFGIIRTPEMKKENIYHVKAIKLRDGEFKWSKSRFTLNSQYLIIEEENIIE